MLIIGGENVFTREIEEVLEKHPGVLAAGVIGKADPLRGELPIAFVELREGQAFDAADLIRCAGGIWRATKCPRRFGSWPRCIGTDRQVMRRELKTMV